MTTREETFETALKDIFRSLLTDVSTAFPATVQTFDGKNNVSVQPIVKALINGEEQNLPVIQDVPVWFPGGSMFSIKWNIVPGDVVLIVCAQRDISNWKTTGGVVSPASRRRFSASDAIAIPGGEPFTTAGSAPTGFKIEGSTGGSIEMDATTGAVTINGNLEVLP